MNADDLNCTFYSLMGAYDVISRHYRFIQIPYDAYEVI